MFKWFNLWWIKMWWIKMWHVHEILHVLAIHTWVLFIYLSLCYKQLFLFVVLIIFEAYFYEKFTIPYRYCASPSMGYYAGLSGKNRLSTQSCKLGTTFAYFFSNVFYTDIYDFSIVSATRSILWSCFRHNYIFRYKHWPGLLLFWAL